jgi:hypothetical protein
VDRLPEEAVCFFLAIASALYAMMIVVRKLVN